MKTLLISLLLTSMFCLAQDKAKNQNDIRLKLNYIITKNMDSELLFKTPKNLAYFFSVSLLFDNNGKIDTVYFSKELSRETKDVMKLDVKLIKRFKMLNWIYKEYSSKLVVLPIYYYRSVDESVSYNYGFLNNIENLFPEVDAKNMKKNWLILDPIINPFNKIVN
ncbi:hypothetical protein [Pedobacter agri]|uniref:hypothetical protein n=1 Tax=Pedobacter agri TaxID=454586 RepID=UPI00292FB032|nr:hypothetical protein [Pedobacter agri]